MFDLHGQKVTLSTKAAQSDRSRKNYLRLAKIRSQCEMAAILECEGISARVFRLRDGLWVSAESNRNNAEHFKIASRHTSSVVNSVLLSNVRRANSGRQIVTMVQATQSRHGYDPASCIGNLHFFPACRRSLPQRKMRPILVVITDVLNHQSF